MLLILHSLLVGQSPPGHRRTTHTGHRSALLRGQRRRDRKSAGPERKGTGCRGSERAWQDNPVRQCVPSFKTYTLAKAHLWKAVDGECLQWGDIKGERIDL